MTAHVPCYPDLKWSKVGCDSLFENNIITARVWFILDLKPHLSNWWRFLSFFMRHMKIIRTGHFSWNQNYSNIFYYNHSATSKLLNVKRVLCGTEQRGLLSIHAADLIEHCGVLIWDTFKKIQQPSQSVSQFQHRLSSKNHRTRILYLTVLQLNTCIFNQVGGIHLK